MTKLNAARILPFLLALAPNAGAGESELVELRTATSRTFLSAEGQMRHAESDVPLHYRGEDGSWRDVDATLVALLGGGFLNDTNSVISRFPADASGEVTLWRRDDGAEVRVRWLGAGEVRAEGRVASDGTLRYAHGDALSEVWSVEPGRVRHGLEPTGAPAGVAGSRGDSLVLEWSVRTSGLDLAPLRAALDDASRRAAGVVRHRVEVDADGMRIVTEIALDASGAMRPTTAGGVVESGLGVVLESIGLGSGVGAAPSVLGGDPCALDPTDTDGDGVCDAIDNCDQQPNPGQADADGDGIGDPCEACDDVLLPDRFEAVMWFGWSVSIDGPRAVVGAPLSDAAGIDAGEAFYYERRGGGWELVQRLTASDAEPGDYFGYSVALDADHLVIGAPLEDTRASDAGAAYVFEQPGATWLERQKLMPDGNDDWHRYGAKFGIAVAIQANKLVVGSPGEYNDREYQPGSFDLVGGAVYFYVHDGWHYADFDKHYAVDQCEQLGMSVATDGGFVVAGGSYDCGGTPWVHIFERLGVDFDLVQRLSGPRYFSSFGRSVAISGLTILVGSFDADGGIGAAYVYDPCVGGGWCETQRLISSDSWMGGLQAFGYAVAVDSGSARALVTAPNLYGGKGAVYEFVRAGGIWTERSAIRRLSGGPHDLPGLGWAVSLSGDVGLVQGGPDGGGSRATVLYLLDTDGDGFEDECDNCPFVANDAQDDFDGDGLGDACDEDADDDGVLDVADPCPFNAGNDPDADGLCFGDDNCPDYFNPGQSDSDNDGLGDPCDACLVTGLVGDSQGIDIDDDTAITGGGIVHVRDASGAWSIQAQLLAGDLYPGVPNAINYGYAVAIHGDTAVVGWFSFAPPPSYLQTGAAYVFVRSGTTWTQQARLLPSGGELGDRFGISVSIDGDTVIVGADEGGPLGGAPARAGYADVFERSGGSWTHQARLRGDDRGANDLFGFKVEISGDTAIVAAQAHDHGASDTGAAYVFTRDGGGTWSQQAELLAASPAADDNFGSGVALDGDLAVVGAIVDDTSEPDTGSAWVYERRAGGAWILRASFGGPPGAQPVPAFGRDVAVSGDTILVGADGETYVPFSVPGGVYVFVRAGVETWIRRPRIVGGCRDGFTVAIEGDTALVGSQCGGGASVYDLLDTDGDGFEDECDNCPFIANDDQADADMDGVGDPCENARPVAEAGAPYLAECGGATTQVPLDGSDSSDPDLDELDYAWSTNCPGGAFDDDASPTPVLTLTSPPPCPVS